MEEPSSFIKLLVVSVSGVPSSQVMNSSSQVTQGCTQGNRCVAYHHQPVIRRMIDSRSQHTSTWKGKKRSLKAPLAKPQKELHKGFNPKWGYWRLVSRHEKLNILQLLREATLPLEWKEPTIQFGSFDISPLKVYERKAVPTRTCKQRVT